MLLLNLCRLTLPDLSPDLSFSIVLLLPILKNKCKKCVTFILKQTFSHLVGLSQLVIMCTRLLLRFLSLSGCVCIRLQALLTPVTGPAGSTGCFIKLCMSDVCVCAVIAPLVSDDWQGFSAYCFGRVLSIQVTVQDLSCFS